MLYAKDIKISVRISLLKILIFFEPGADISNFIENFGINALEFFLGLGVNWLFPQIFRDLPQSRRGYRDG